MTKTPSPVWSGEHVEVTHNAGWTYYKGFAGNSYHGATFDIRSKNSGRAYERIFETVEVNGRRGKIAQNEAIEKAKQIDANFAAIMQKEAAAIAADEERRAKDAAEREAAQRVRDAAPDLLDACEAGLAMLLAAEADVTRPCAAVVRMRAAIAKAKGESK